MIFEDPKSPQENPYNFPPFSLLHIADKTNKTVEQLDKTILFLKQYDTPWVRDTMKLASMLNTARQMTSHVCNHNLEMWNLPQEAEALVASRTSRLTDTNPGAVTRISDLGQRQQLFQKMAAQLETAKDLLINMGRKGPSQGITECLKAEELLRTMAVSDCAGLLIFDLEYAKGEKNAPATQSAKPRQPK